ncbi:D-2-hydroxyacid dehydrogenase [Lentilactobacillus senioris]|uniref:D-2-hydroxyacid dehydrogenase n=1 Tax=Lentilactobacillus senioris TaxID=931534 RepID=UPI002281A74C|nr:D-2-hydroxyacid dehydrogenase [Lentilactobacillus senioris]MCY9806150.1 D-2-hydroxyacid dehydrogenase [Lentilactobacillus senioris]
MKNIITSMKLTAEQQQQLEQLAPDYQIISDGVQANSEQLANTEVLLGWDPAFAKLLDNDNQLKWVQTFSAGVDSLPLTQLAQANVTLTNARGTNAENIAQQTLGYMLVYERKFYSILLEQQKHRWNREHQFSELTGKTAVLFGTGQIGSHIARLAKAFGMHVIGINRHGEALENFDEVTTFEAGISLLKDADYVITSLPLTPATKDYFNADLFAKMGSQTFFINVGRGASVVTNDLNTALRNGQLAGAAVDVTNPEPLPADNPLWDAPNIIITPHDAGFSDQINQRVWQLIIENVKAYVQGETLKNLVDYQQGY